jgi:hypothetical protein
MDLSNAIGVLGFGLNTEGAFDRTALRRRLIALLTLLEHAGTEGELLAAAALDAVEGGSLEPAEMLQRFGKATAKMVEQCTALRAVPVLPSGKLPRSYFESARSAPREVRRVCAAHLAALASEGDTESTHYMRVHLEALQAGEADDLVETATAAVETERRAA